MDITVTASITISYINGDLPLSALDAEIKSTLTEIEREYNRCGTYACCIDSDKYKIKKMVNTIFD